MTSKFRVGYFRVDWEVKREGVSGLGAYSLK